MTSIYIVTCFCFQDDVSYQYACKTVWIFYRWYDWINDPLGIVRPKGQQAQVQPM